MCLATQTCSLRRTTHPQASHSLQPNTATSAACSASPTH
jgi:hypothetical protein